jgi:hypothetical protein
MKFHENPFIRYRVVSCVQIDRRTDRVILTGALQMHERCSEYSYRRQHPVLSQELVDLLLIISEL